MIYITNLTKNYSHFTALKDIHLEVNSGQIIALIGPNGSGKSTLLKSILKLVTPDSGSIIQINKTDILDKSYLLDHIGYMPQLPDFPSNLKVSEIMETFEYITPEEPIYKDLIYKELSINSFLDKKFGELSGGMKQKVNIYQCFMYKRNLLVLDEPSASLDPDMSHYLKELIIRRKKDGSTILFTSHILSEVENFADEFILLQDGRLKVQDSPVKFIEKQKASSLEHALYLYYQKENQS